MTFFKGECCDWNSTPIIKCVRQITITIILNNSSKIMKVYSQSNQRTNYKEFIWTKRIKIIYNSIKIDLEQLSDPLEMNIIDKRYT
jgi:hypothetical protein